MFNNKKKEDEEMGLDWISAISTTKEKQEDYIRKHYAERLETETMETLVEQCAPSYSKPCSFVGAVKMRDIPNFEKASKEEYDLRKLSQKGVTFEEYKEAIADKWSCDHCPFLQKLQGADSRGSFFLGITVASCDFRGKLIGSDEEISERLRDLAYEDLSRERMNDYADLLELELEELRQEGALEKPSYNEYVKEYKTGGFAANGMFSKKDYEKALHWREQNLKDAIRWLRTCSESGIHMRASY